jgi:tetrapyrrole methylase family protein / MazG family protein
LNTVTIVSVSSGDVSLLTVGALETLKNAKRILLRTERHPVAAWLTEHKLAFEPLDSLYDSAETFDAFNRSAAASVLAAAAESAVAYVVADAAMDSSVSVLLQIADDRDKVILLPGVSYADRCLAMAKADSQDIRLSSAETFLSGDDLNPSVSCFLYELHSRECAGTCKIKLMRLLDDQTPLYFFSGGSDGSLRMETVALLALDRQERYDHLTACLYVAAPMTQRKRFGVDDLFAVMKRLRAKDGCPWDREQTHESLLPNLLEESYEFIDAVREADPEHMCEELGDVLLQVMFHAVIAGQCGEFDLHDVTTAITEKLIVRHPHVFGTVKADTASQVLDNWDKIKRRQRGIDSVADAMDNVSTGMSATMRAAKVQHKAAKVKFDFPDAKAALEKVGEESREILECLDQGTDPQEELGDLLFSAVNVCRLCAVNPDIALYASVNKFIRRFRGMEKAVQNDGKSIEDLTLREMDVYWVKEKHTSTNDPD